MSQTLSVCVQQPILHPQLLLRLCPEPPHFLLLSQPWHLCESELRHMSPLQVLHSPSFCAWQPLPGRDGGVLAGNSLWVSTRACCACMNTADRQTDAHIPPPTHTCTDTCPPLHWTPTSSQNCHPVPQITSFSACILYIPGALTLPSVSSRNKMEGT